MSRQDARREGNAVLTHSPCSSCTSNNDKATLHRFTTTWNFGSGNAHPWGMAGIGEYLKRCLCCSITLKIKCGPDQGRTWGHIQNRKMEQVTLKCHTQGITKGQHPAARAHPSYSEARHCPVAPRQSHSPTRPPQPQHLLSAAAAPLCSGSPRVHPVSRSGTL